MSPSVRAVAAGLLVLTASPVHAADNITDVFAAAPRIDLALELEYRSRYLAPDIGMSGHLPGDRIGRERLEDSRLRVARAYLDVLGDALVDAVVDQVPIAEALERRYRQYSVVRLLGEDPNALGPPTPQGTLWAPPTPRPFSLRLRLNAISEGLDLAPGLELVRGALEWRVAYRPLHGRVETTARRPLTERLALELTGGQSVEHGGPSDIRIGLSLQF